MNKHIVQKKRKKNRNGEKKLSSDTCNIKNRNEQGYFHVKHVNLRKEMDNIILL